ncbi:MAG TPA: hypothetical protein VGW32_07915 [Pyrinomonadaceae bacterium]|nr:hypothetical protein [Pyrinomonadaceae bacterium]
MKSIYSKLFLVALVTLVSLPMMASAQTTKPRMRRATTPRRVVPLVPVGTNLKVRLEDTLSSKESRAGDKFTATVLDPVRFNEATVRGHIRSIVKSGKIKGRTTMNLAFDSITLLDGRTGTLHGYVTRVYDSNARSDEEGGVQSEGRGRQTIKRGAIGGTAGAIIGAIAGGGKGAAIGLIVGGAAGAGSLAVGGSKELKLEAGTEMLLHVTR